MLSPQKLESCLINTTQQERGSLEVNRPNQPRQVSHILSIVHPNQIPPDHSPPRLHPPRLRTDPTAPLPRLPLHLLRRSLRHPGIQIPASSLWRETHQDDPSPETVRLWRDERVFR
jgi:hypothetical protein